MTVAELIQKLNEYPQDMRVLTLGYEGGFDDIDLETKNIIFNTNEKDRWYYGTHDEPEYGQTGTKCVIIGRGK